MEQARYVLNDLFLSCMCKRFLELPGKKILLLVGSELSTRIKRRIDDLDLPVICRFLHNNPNVVSVNLAYNHITDKGMTHIISFLEENSTLLELNLMNNNIKGKGIIKLSRLKNMICLKSLRLNGNRIGPKGLNKLAMMLSMNQTLVNLDVGETDMNIESLIQFTAVLRLNNQSLQSITLNRILGPPGHILQTDLVAQAIERTLSMNNTLKELHLQKIGFMDHDIQTLVEGLKQNNTILLLDLSCNNIGDFGMECLAEYLGTKPQLLTLMISHNNIRDTGARSLSFKFPYSNITFLDISRNKITEDGLLDILNCLKKERPIQGLFIRGNQIGPKTCKDRTAGLTYRGGGGYIPLGRCTNISFPTEDFPPLKVLFRMILSGVLFDEFLDVNVYREKDKFVFTCTESEDHLKPHYYCLCANTQNKYCCNSSVMEIRNKDMD